MRFFLVIFLLLGGFPSLHAQTLTGSVTNSEGLPLSMASILIKEADQPQNILEFTQSKAGKFSLKLSKSYQKLRIDVMAYSHAPDSVIIRNPQKDSIYTFHFKLAFVVQELKEVVVVGKKRPIEVKEDTVLYNVNSFRDGSEKKLEDVLKKMPGIKIDEQSGIISYKGKQVEAVTLEGDDLFGKNYTIGTRNINVDMVEQVQAIDNYSANPLLKDIEASDKVSLNLKIKKNRFDFSGNFDVGLGLTAAADAAINAKGTLLGITRSYKSFAMLAHNNLGINNTPYDHFANSQSAERTKEMHYYAPKVIAESSTSSPLAANRVNVNQQFFASHNAVFKIGKRLSVKNNLYFLKDDIYGYQLSKVALMISGYDFNFSDLTTTHKRPTLYRSDLEIKYNTSKTSLLEYNFRISEENIQTSIQTRMNERFDFESRLESRDVYLQQRLLFTQKIDKKRALQLHLWQSTSRVPQMLTLSPSALRPDTAQTDRQASRFQKDYLEAKATLLGAVGNGKYSFSLGLKQDKSPYRSALSTYLAEGTLLGSPILNHLVSKQQTIYQTGAYTHLYKNWKLGMEYAGSYLYQELISEKTLQKRGDFIIEPTLTVGYKLAKYALVSVQGGYKQASMPQNYLFSQDVLVNSRTTISNTPVLRIQSQQFYSLNYYVNNMEKFFTIHAMAMHYKMMGNFFADFAFKERTARLNNFFLSEPLDNLNLMFSIGQFFKELLFKLDANTNYNVMNYKNVVNKSKLRSNQSRSFSGNLGFTSIFDFPVNFRNKAEYRQSAASTEGISGTFKNESFTNNFTVTIRPHEDWFISLTSDYYLPNLKRKTDNYWFLDATLSYNPSKSRFDFYLTGKNLLNKKTFGQTQTTDYGLSIHESNLLPRYATGTVSFQF